MKIIISSLFLAMAFSSVAQQEEHHHKHDMGKMAEFLPAITRSIGGTFQKFDGLNGRVANLPQYKQLKDYTATLGFGWFKEQNRFISEASFNIGSSLSAKRDEKSSTIRYLGASMDLGYDLLKSDKITLYPLAGLGIQTYQAIFYKDNSAVDFNDVLETNAVQNSISSVRFRNTFVVYRAGFGVTFKSPKYPSSSIGLQAGYTGSFQKHEWKTNEGQLLGNAPEDRISQFFISLVLASKPWMMMKR
jgi:hypothetical protein